MAAIRSRLSWTPASAVAMIGMALCAPPVLAGDGSFPGEPAGSPFTTGTDPLSLAVGDFDSDGDQDVAVTNGVPDTITLYRGAGNGSLACQPPCLSATDTYPRSIAAADFNNDGHQDLVTANALGDSVTVRLGAGNGTFPTLATLSGAGADGPASVAVGFFNVDPHLDLAVANYLSGDVSVFLGAGNGSFSEAAGSAFGTGTGSHPQSVAVGDFNSDGRDDMAVALNGSDAVSVHLSAGMIATPFPDPPVTYGTGDGPEFVAVGDYNSDGIEDLALANHGSSGVTVRLGAGDGSFAAEAPGSPFAVGGQPSSIAVGDFNSDGRQDLAVTNESTDQVSVRLGAGDGSFPAQPAGSPFGSGLNHYFAAVGDFNSDGNEDLALANSQDPSFSVRLGAGAPLLAGNLLVNGGAEGAGAATLPPEAPSIPSWAPRSGAMTFVRYSSAGDFPRLLDSARWEGGMNFFSAGGDDMATAVTSATQSVDVSAAAASIDARLATARLQADLGGFRATNDAMVVSAAFRDGAGQSVGSFEIGPVGATDRKNLTTLLRRARAAPVPAGTRSIDVALTATRPSGTVNHAYADNIKLTLDAPPPGDTVRPDLALSGRRVQRLAAFVSVGARCASESCHVKATGVLVIRRPQRKSRPRRLKVRNASADLPAAERHKLKLKIRRKTRRAARAALKHGAKVRAKLTVTATDAAGNRTVRHRTVRLRLPKHRSR
jgi:VCBS repeat protein